MPTPTYQQQEMERRAAHYPDLLTALEAAQATLMNIADVAGDVPMWNIGGEGYVATTQARAAIAAAKR